MASTASFKVVFCFAVCYLAILASGVGLGEDLKTVDEKLNLRDSNVMRTIDPLDLKYLPRADTVTITVTETVCAFSSMTFSKPSTTIWIPPVPTMATTTSIPTPQTTIPTSDSTPETFTTSSAEQTTSHGTSSTSSTDASTPVPSSSEQPFAPPLSDTAPGQGKIHFALLVWSLVMTGFMNV
ncbi:hypothetical protein CNMCM5793_007055 [Aspergillus hiratsukae]|uniref:Uncharacterized protein n=1 Tax=Aspergillus hiratsukae TaxID=1194566 RepID=A0A8H6NZV2_9EURO|nr:hypothetical protein CNMCM5793_007055 [Aspergillus hiratsukae]KAF7157383.1 hypothetical protein CNMCM6106_002966 [Aspergillus hiratsukae]